MADNSSIYLLHLVFFVIWGRCKAFSPGLVSLVLHLKEVIKELVDTGVRTTMENKLKKKLHEAIEESLKISNRPLRPSEIADMINTLSLYERGDGQAITSSQVSARANNYSRLFDINDNQIYLKHWDK